MTKTNTPAPQTRAPAPSTPKAKVPEGFVELYAPEGCTGCSFEGTEYEVADGIAVVPFAAVGDLLCHGFTTTLKDSK